MEDRERLRSLIQELTKVEASRESLGSEATDGIVSNLLAQIVALSSGGDQTIEIHGNAGPGAVVGSGSLQAGAIAGRDIISGRDINIYSSEENKAQIAEEEYLKELVEINSRLFLGPLDTQARYSSPSPDLARLYIPLDVNATVPVEGDAGDLLGKDRSLSVIEVISQHRHLVLLGNPGSGKSTVLKYLTWCLASMRLHGQGVKREREKDSWAEKLPGWQEGPLLPVPISLPDIAQWMTHTSSSGGISIDNYLLYYLSTKLSVPQFAQYMRAFIRQGEAILFCDGLDEVTDLDIRKQILALLRQFALIHADTRIIVTCRVLSYSNPALQIGGDFIVHILAGLTLGQAQQFIRSWYNLLIEKNELKRDVAQSRANNLVHLIGQGLAEFWSTPLLLTVLVIVHASTGDLPQEKARLYDQCCEILLWQWQKAKPDVGGQTRPGIYDVLETRIERLRSALAHLAYHNHSRQGTLEETPDISESEAISIFRHYFGSDSNDLQKSADAYRKAKLFLDYLESDSGLLIAKGRANDLDEPMFGFIHRTFEEFLAGYYLTTQLDLNRRLAELIRKENSDQWYEVMRLAIGHMVFNSSRVAFAIDAAKYMADSKFKTKLQEGRAIWWAAEILAIVGKEIVEKDDVAGRYLLPDVCERLAQLLTAGLFAPRRLEAAGNALAKIGDPRESVTGLPPTFVTIPGGVFVMGVDESVQLVSRNEQPASDVDLKLFEISRYPVTNIQFRAFVNDCGYTDKHRDCWTEQGWRWRASQNWTCPEFIDDPDLGVLNKPVVGVSWFEAIAYVNWLSKKFDMRFRLPTEAEWERTARGVDERLYPWGDSWRENAANVSELGLGVSTSVGIFPAGDTIDGCGDMIGNVWEWCQSLYKSYPYDPDDGREDLDGEGPRILRGGSYQTSYLLSRCTYRMWRFPAYRNRYTGFRLVRMDKTEKVHKQT